MTYSHRGRFAQVCKGLGLQLDDAQLESFERFEKRLYEVNAMFNLTRVPRQECWLRHFVDSLLFHDLIPRGAKVLDIGSGPGFPAWPLAAARPDLFLTALDSSGKMLGFLRSNLLPNLETVLARAEDWGVREKFDVVTGRAVAPLPIQLELSAQPLKVGGRFIPMRSRNDLEEIEVRDASYLGLKLLTIEQRTLPGTDIIRLFPVYEKFKWTAKKYPRAWTTMRIEFINKEERAEGDSRAFAE